MKRHFILALFSGALCFPVAAQQQQPKPKTAAVSSSKAWLIDSQRGSETQWEYAKRIALLRAGTFIGPVAKSTLNVCLLSGYPHNEGTYNDLSRRQVAECDDILERCDRIVAAHAKEKARLDAEWEKKHPKP